MTDWACSEGLPGLNLEEHIAGVSTLTTTRPFRGVSSSGMPTSILIPAMADVLPILTRAEPSAVPTEPVGATHSNENEMM